LVRRHRAGHWKQEGRWPWIAAFDRIDKSGTAIRLMANRRAPGHPAMSQLGLAFELAPVAEMATLLAPPRSDDGTRISRSLATRSFGVAGSIARPRSSVEALWSRPKVGTRSRTHSYPSPTNAYCKWRNSKVSLVCRHPAGPGFAPPRLSSSRLHFRRLGFIPPYAVVLS
jgi:hypothetical protein